MVEKSRRISMNAFSLRSMRYASRMFYTRLSKETGIPQRYSLFNALTDPEAYDNLKLTFNKTEAPRFRNLRLS